MILRQDAKLLVVHRRLFEADEPRLFIGKVDEFDGALVKITGYTWSRTILDDVPIKKQGERTKIISLASGGFLIYYLPDHLHLGSARFEFAEDGRLWLKVDPGYALDMSEHYYRRIEHRVA